MNVEVQPSRHAPAGVVMFQADDAPRPDEGREEVR